MRLWWCIYIYISTYTYIHIYSYTIQYAYIYYLEGRRLNEILVWPVAEYSRRAGERPAGTHPGKRCALRRRWGCFCGERGPKEKESRRERRDSSCVNSGLFRGQQPRRNKFSFFGVPNSAFFVIRGTCRKRVSFGNKNKYSI